MTNLAVGKTGYGYVDEGILVAANNEAVAEVVRPPPELHNSHKLHLAVE